MGGRFDNREEPRPPSRQPISGTILRVGEEPGGPDPSGAGGGGRGRPIRRRPTSSTPSPEVAVQEVAVQEVARRKVARPRTPGRAVAAAALAALAAVAGCGGGSEPTGPDGLPLVPAEATAWIEARAVVLEELDEPLGTLDDLEPLREVVGEARVVALGEATHGTREFLRVRHRILRFLVEEMGFDALALEAPLPEAGRVDDYVLGGSRDPERLLSGLYLWPWNTREMLELVQWMRALNRRREARQARFFGLDVQFPGMAIHEVKRFVAAVDPGGLDEVEEGMACLERFANDPTGAFPTPGYAAQLRQAYREPCRADLEGVVAFLEARASAYTRASSLEAYAWALRNARVAVQFEEHASSLTFSARDLAMAENAEWILERLGPDGKLVLWAHNDHVGATPGSTGWALRQRLGPEVLLVGLTFSRGAFNAEGPGAARPAAHAVEGPVPRSYGHFLGSPGLSGFALDLRGRDFSPPGASWLPGPRSLRSVGLDFDPTSPGRYVRQARLPEEFDVVVHVRESHPSTLLPFRYPDGF